MERKIIKIDEIKCNGCALCANACHEGAIAMVNGKAKLMRDDYCDGMGDCLPSCPTGAISFEMREAAAYDEAAVAAKNKSTEKKTPAFSGCPGTAIRAFGRREQPAMHTQTQTAQPVEDTQSELMQWPVQIKLVPPNAQYFDGANLLVAADCTAFAYADFHKRFIKNHITLIGCPKLDSGDYAEKLTEILKSNEIKSVTVVRMQVPCCGGLENAVKQALRDCGKMIPWQVAVISTDGVLIDL